MRQKQIILKSEPVCSRTDTLLRGLRIILQNLLNERKNRIDDRPTDRLPPPIPRGLPVTQYLLEGLPIDLVVLTGLSLTHPLDQNLSHLLVGQLCPFGRRQVQ